MRHRKQSRPGRTEREREREADLDFDERHKSARSRVRDDKNDYARAKRSLPHLIVVVKRYSLRWIWFSRVKFIVTRTLTILFVASFFPSFSLGRKKKKKRRIKLEKLRTRARSVTIRFVTLDEGKQGGLLSFMGYGSPADL